ncbi:MULTISPECIES: DUF2795 domain-containing protein [Saccharopolyspora]|jgi:hypothetical protein|uniref:DUF2795 domain-containing protein n=2 Tax=Saccharopolyspora TaxID=1835 RepID=A0A4R4VYS1_9PSEU|nr:MULTISPECIES: DUF2795 domain-containing protein [Saccharopolyspora]MBQ0926773.1 DUF2795 domain-containing protein [Saccharopolyspora endophytica]TDD08613.1 DUF2795 domain-containing protein [Saccharopolyspora terrae]
MTKRDEMRVDKALQGLEFPADREQLVDFATDREADSETLTALRSIPARRYANKDEVIEAVPQEPEGDAPGGTARG